MIKLYAPDSYVAASAAVRCQVVNGCGPGGWKVDLIPDTMWGLSVAPACDIHDWMYATGQTIADKDEADRTFLNNVLRLIDGADGWFNQLWLVKKLRRLRAREYYEAVHLFGGPAFWAGKNPDTHLIAACEASARA
ncbi:hypothetical protein KI809_10640 [Geobacter pelophilus]|uniref:DUF1353 domain-containing protein n=1 Tax=Geoanaerobacter pelophilus TaxID=60036 RepID=A0AAW4L3I3_9BACT|nr:hypothetical protein [Geoanaerobacter pelophilus]MBT0664757.1 hypothetical protein [Geoanaerobacter pelophilus]